MSEKSTHQYLEQILDKFDDRDKISAEKMEIMMTKQQQILLDLTRLKTEMENFNKQKEAQSGWFKTLIGASFILIVMSFVGIGTVLAQVNNNEEDIKDIEIMCKEDIEIIQDDISLLTSKHEFDVFRNYVLDKEKHIDKRIDSVLK